MTTWLFIAYFTLMPTIGHEHDYGSDRGACVEHVRELAPFRYLVTAMCVPEFNYEGWTSE